MSIRGLGGDARASIGSSLTTTGVIIGVAGIIVLGAADGGANKKLEEQIAIQGANTLSVHRTPAANAGQRGPVVLLVDEDAGAIKERVPDIQATRCYGGGQTVWRGGWFMRFQMRRGRSFDVITVL
jgi:hypothetical protein